MFAYPPQLIMQWEVTSYFGLTKYPTGPHRTPPGHTGPNRTQPAQLSTETVRQKTYPKPAAYTGELELKYYL